MLALFAGNFSGLIAEEENDECMHTRTVRSVAEDCHAGFGFGRGTNPGNPHKIANGSVSPLLYEVPVISTQGMHCTVQYVQARECARRSGSVCGESEARICPKGRPHTTGLAVVSPRRLFDDILSPPSARQLGASHQKGEGRRSSWSHCAPCSNRWICPPCSLCLVPVRL